MLAPENQQHVVRRSISRLIQIFILVYLFLYMFPFPLNQIPLIEIIFSFYNKGMEYLTIWLGEHVLGMEKLTKIKLTGSGDTSFDYVQILTLLVLAFCVSILVFTIKISENKFRRFAGFMYTYARYYLAVFLLIYGFAKFYEGQFVSPDIAMLERKFGDASPMGLLWTFMGFSKAYTVFGGICEVAGACLLFFRRTTALGAIIAMMVMTNVAMLNFAYDVPVKIFSTHLTLISIFILFPNLYRLFQFFCLNRVTQLKQYQLKFQNKWVGYGRIILKTLILLGFPVLFISSDLKVAKTIPKHQLNGAYFTTTFVKNQDTISSYQIDSTRWNKLLINDNYAVLIFDNESEVYYKFALDSAAHTIKLKSYSDTAIAYQFNYYYEGEKGFTLNGVYDADTIAASFKVKRMEDYTLINRGFHWINEYPYNR